MSVGVWLKYEDNIKKTSRRLKILAETLFRPSKRKRDFSEMILIACALAEWLLLFRLVFQLLPLPGMVRLSAEALSGILLFPVLSRGGAESETARVFAAMMKILAVGWAVWLNFNDSDEVVTRVILPSSEPSDADAGASAEVERAMITPYFVWHETKNKEEIGEDLLR